MKAFGFASNNACDARASVARSCDCVTAIATSFNDCPGFTVYWPPAAYETDAASGALAASPGAATALLTAAPASAKAKAAATRPVP
jgi:hypothetical protein